VCERSTFAKIEFFQTIYPSSIASNTGPGAKSTNGEEKDEGKSMSRLRLSSADASSREKDAVGRDLSQR